MREQYSTQLARAAGVLILIASAVFSLVQSPEMLEFNDVAAVKSSPPVPHPAEGYSKCNSCHALKSENPYSLKHAGWSNESCLRCHEIDKNAVAISALPGADFSFVESVKLGERASHLGVRWF